MLLHQGQVFLCQDPIKDQYGNVGLPNIYGKHVFTLLLDNQSIRYSHSEETGKTPASYHENHGLCVVAFPKEGRYCHTRSRKTLS